MKWFIKLTSISKSRIFNRYLLSYITVLVFGLFIGLTAYFMSVDIIETEITKAHYNSLRLVQGMTDKVLQELDQVYIQIGFDQRVQMLMSLSGEIQPAYLIDRSKVEEELRIIKMANPIIQQIYIYFSRDPIVLNEVGNYQLDVFYQSVFPYSEYDFNQWLDSDQSGPIICSTSNGEGIYENIMVYIKPLPIGRSNNLLGKLIIIVDENVMKQSIEKLRWIPESNIFMIDDRDQIYPNPMNLTLPAELESALMQDGTIISANRQAISSIKSDDYPWSYLSVIPVETFFARAQGIKDTVILSFFVLFIFGLSISYLMARKNYGPVSRLVRFIQESMKSSNEMPSDEYNYVQKVLTDIINQNVDYQKNINRQSQTIKNNLLVSMINGQLDDQALDAMNDTYNIGIYPKHHYSLILISVENISLSDYNIDLESGLEDSLEAARIIFTNTFGSLINEKYHMIAISFVDSLALLVDIGDDFIEQAGLNMKIIAQRATAMITGDLKMTFTAAISDIHQGYNGIKIAFKEANQSLNYGLLLGKQQIFFYHDWVDGNQRLLDFDFRRDLELLSQSIRSLNQTEFQNYSQRIIDFWFSDHICPISIIRFRMNELINTYIMSIEELKGSGINVELNYIDVLDRLQKCRSIRDLQCEMTSFYHEIIAVAQLQDGVESNLHQKVLQYIKENYHIPNINISAIAGSFNVNIPYLSRQFKKQMGIGPLEYLQFIRIEKAKQLLKTTSYSINEIMTKSGFISDVSFIRVFKKYEGITPGAYRKNHR